VADHFETKGLFTGIAMFLVGLIPTIGNIVGGGQVVNDIHKKLTLRKEKGWVGFLGKARNTLHDINN
jgi:hypothetical protein